MRTWSFALLLLPVIASTGWVLTRPSAPSAGQRVEASAQVSSASPSSTARGERREESPWVAGDTRVYEVSTSNQTRISQNAGSTPIDIVIEGRLTFTVLRAVDGRVELGAQLDPRKVTLKGATNRVIEAAVRAPFVARVDQTGALLELAFESGTPVEGRQLLAAIVSAVRLSHQADKSSYSASERDGTGEMTAYYRRQGGVETRAVGAYQRIFSDEGLVDPSQAGKVSTQSATTARYEDRSMWPVEVRGEGSFSVTSESPRMVSRNEWRTTARLVEVGRRSVDAPEPWVEALQGQEQGNRQAFAKARRNMDEGRVSGASFEQIMAEVKAAKTPREIGKAQVRLAALARLDPAATASAAKSVLSGSIGDEERKVVFAALSSSGTREGHRVLVESIAAAERPEVRAMAASMLGMAPAVDPENKPALVKAMSDEDPTVRDNATLALGNAARGWSAQGMAQSDDAFDALSKRLEAASTMAEKIVCIDALGNMGDERALPLLTPFSLGGPADLRLAAIAALRQIPGDGADQLLSALVSDPDPQARQAAVQAMGYRPHAEGVLAALTRCARSDAAVAVRVQVVHTLGKLAPRSAAAVELLAWQAASDPSSEVRDEARTEIASKS